MICLFLTYVGPVFMAGAPRVSHSVIKLPLKLVIKPCLPVKTANFKVTVDTNKAPVNLNELFPGERPLAYLHFGS